MKAKEVLTYYNRTDLLFLVITRIVVTVKMDAYAESVAKSSEIEFAHFNSSCVLRRCVLN